jgi:phosphoribosylformimino-5-aminoimidazole carboxamide ribonucleotide (ProFAR) isomerase
MQIIPALCIADGKVAAFRPGYNDALPLPDDPYQLMERLGKADILRIHLVDIDAARHEGITNLGLIGSLANVCIPQLEVAGGLQSLDHIRSLRFGGADLFVLGSVVYEKPQFLEEIIRSMTIKPDSIMIALDLVKGELTFHSWKEKVQEEDLYGVIRRMLDLGFTRVLVTDVDIERKDQGPDVAFLTDLVQKFPQVKFTLAGHIRDYADIDRLKAAGVHEVIVGQEFYQDDAALKRISDYNLAEGEAWD